MRDAARDSDASASATAEVLFALRAIASEVARVDLRTADANELELSAVVATLGNILDRTIGMLVQLQTFESDAAEEIAMDFEEPDAWAPREAVSLAPQIGDVSFAGSLELRRVQRELASATSATDRLVAAEVVCRKLRRAVRAVLESARETGVLDVLGGSHQNHHQVSDLASGLAVRRLYAEFRRALRSPTRHDAEAVLEAVRYAVGALATLVAAPDYADVRASDRAILRELRERALRWARGDRGVAGGLNLLDDVRTCGDLLRGINRRQEIRAHDTTLIRTLVAADALDDATYFHRLADLYGLDDQLDELIARARAATPSSVRGAVVARLRQVQ